MKKQSDCRLTIILISLRYADHIVIAAIVNFDPGRCAAHAHAFSTRCDRRRFPQSR